MLIKFLPEIPQHFLFVLLIWPLFTLTAGHLVAEGDLDKVYDKRIQRILASNYNPALANRWRNELTAEGIWVDVDYTAGCPARRANWPAQDHFHRIITMSSSWYRDQEDADLRQKISLALDYWFDRDFQHDDCISGGGVDRLNCPCGTPGFWNTNWYCQMILMPGLVGTTCLLLKSDLTPTQLSNFTAQTSRSYVRLDGDPNGMQGPQTGANLLDVSSIGISLALLSADEEIMVEAVGRIYDECTITEGGRDGIKVDGSYMQHSTQLYTGNYGKVFMGNMLKIFIETGDTALSPPPAVQAAFLTLISGSEWFIYLKTEKEGDPFAPILSWQYSVIGRMVSHKYEDWRGIDLSFNDLMNGTRTWDNHLEFAAIVDRLRSAGPTVNPGPVIGTRFFHTSDFLVHRGTNYIVALKMFSKRTTNSECNNSQNPYGFHLSDGVIYSHLHGNEYTNVYGAWDWNLIPGSTVDYGATPLACNRVQFKGVEDFVGGVALDEAGVAVMNYTNPMTGSLTWLKTYFFFPNAYAVQFVGHATSSNASAAVVTTLDQRQLSGPVYIDGQPITETEVRRTAQTLWHDGVLYDFLQPVNLTVDTRVRPSNWSEIGISDGFEPQNLFAAYFEHPPGQPGTGEQFTYTAHLGVAPQDIGRLRASADDGGVRIIGVGQKKVGSALAAADVRGASYGNAGGVTVDRIVSLAFLTAGEYFTGLEDIMWVETNAPLLLLFQRKANNMGWRLATADPTQTLTSAHISVQLVGNPVPVNLNFSLPFGEWAGSAAINEF